MTKKEAAEFLQVSEKTIERYKAAGDLSAKMKRVIGFDGKSRMVLDFDVSDLERVKRKMFSEVVYPEVTSDIDRPHRQTDRDTSKNKGLVKVGQTQTNAVEAILQRIEQGFEKQQTASRLGQKILLTLKECRALTGLSEDRLRKDIKSGNLKATKLGGWKVKRIDLDKFIENL